MKKIEDYVLSIPDFPEPGIIFRDITSVLQDADGPELDEGINGIVAVSRGAVLDIRPDQPEFLVVEDGAACDVQRPRDFADRKQISFFFHKIPLKTQKTLASHVNVRCMIPSYRKSVNMQGFFTGSRGCPSARPRMTEKCEHIR